MLSIFVHSLYFLTSPVRIVYPIPDREWEKTEEVILLIWHEQAFFLTVVLLFVYHSRCKDCNNMYAFCILQRIEENPLSPAAIAKWCKMSSNSKRIIFPREESNALMIGFTKDNVKFWSNVK